MQLIILAGGFGTRLSSINGGKQKCMTLINGVPLLEYQIRSSVAQGITRICLLLHYKSCEVMEYFGDGEKFGATINYIEEPFPLGSGGALYQAKKYFDDTFLILYGDLYHKVNLKKLFDFHVKNKADLTLLTHPNSHPYDSDLIIVNENSRVTDLRAPPHSGVYKNLVNSGMYVASKGIFEGLVINQKQKLDFARDLIPVYIKNHKKILSYQSVEYIKDMGTPDRLKSVLRDIDKDIPSKLKDETCKKVIFLDRDGTLNPDSGHIAKEADFAFYPEIPKHIRKINEDGTLCVVITNQPVVARGEASFSQLELIHNKMQTLAGQEGAYFDAIFYCPHHPDSGYIGEIKSLKVRCLCRKPNIGLLKKAQKLFSIDKKKSWIIGDSYADIGAGKKFGIKTILIEHEKSLANVDNFKTPDYIFQNTKDAINWALYGYDDFYKFIESSFIDGFGDNKVILVGGLSHSGKTTFSNVLKDVIESKYNKKAHILSLDSFLLEKKIRREIKDVECRYNLKKINLCIDKLLSNRGVFLPIYSKYTGNFLNKKKKIKMSNDDILIVEGVIALMLNIKKSYKIYYSCSDEERNIRFSSHYLKRALIDGISKDAGLINQSAEIDKISNTVTNADINLNYDNYKNTFKN